MRYRWLSGIPCLGRKDSWSDDRRLLGTWVKKHQDEVLPKSQTGKAFAYSINQEKYLRVFLEDGEVPLDNNATESTLRGFCIGKHNWRLIDTIRGAKSSAIIYSITETAKANNLKIYEYVEYLLTEIPKHEDDTNLDFLEDLLPCSPGLQTCRSDAGNPISMK